MKKMRVMQIQRPYYNKKLNWGRKYPVNKWGWEKLQHDRFELGLVSLR